MARLREFDIDEALDAAMQAFWRHGYEATSLADLMAATGLQKGSIYKAFKDKHTLFIRALSRYLEQLNDFHREYIEQAESPKAGLTRWLHNVVETYSGAEDGRGCFAVNSLIELAPHDREVKQLLAQQVKQLQALLDKEIAQGQALGEFRTDIAAEDLSLVLINLVYGAVASSKCPLQKAQLQRQAEVAIALIQ